LFSGRKTITRLLFLTDGRTMFVEAFPFNQSRTPPRLA
jgi:hypothetical protein